MIRCCICDDKTEDGALLLALAEGFSREHPQWPLRVDVFHSPYDLLEAVRDRGGYDLYLLDVLMPHLSGVEVAQKLRERGERAQVLFLTVSREYAVDAFAVKASGYLVKPIQKEAFDREVLECVRRLAPRDNPAIVLKTKAGLRRVGVRELVLVESFNHCRVCTLAEGDTVETAVTLSALQEQLREYPCFARPHRAYLVNLDFAQGLTRTELLMTGGRRVPVSRNAYGRLKRIYLNYIFPREAPGATE